LGERVEKDFHSKWSLKLARVAISVKIYMEVRRDKEGHFTFSKRNNTSSGNNNF
jgi:hypothetical protein